MTQSLQVLCVDHIGSRDAHGHITGIGGKNGDGSPWSLTEAKAIQGIRDGRWHFYVEGGGQRTTVIIASRNGHEFLKTEADSTTRDNLLSLRRCPA